MQKAFIFSIIVLLNLSCMEKPTAIDINEVIDTMTDQDGNVYKTVKIGNQWWMAENLKVTHYRNGDAIPNVTDDAEWGNLTTSAYCAYNNDNGNISTYGLLYNWYAVDDSRTIAPAGWHVPTDEEWKTMEIYLGMSQSEADLYGGDRDSGVGNKLKALSGWDSNNGNNESGFTAMPGGARSGTNTTDGWISNVAFHHIGREGFWWTSSIYYSKQVLYRKIWYEYSVVYREAYPAETGFSLRLVKD